MCYVVEYIGVLFLDLTLGFTIIWVEIKVKEDMARTKKKILASLSIRGAL